MYFDKFVKQYVEVQKNLKETNLSASQVTDAQTDGATMYNSSNIETHIALLVAWVFLFLFILLKKREIKLKRNSSSVEDLHPCKTCRFFANNHYLQCAVRPSIVLTKQAMDCPDYCVQKNKFFGQLNS